MDSGQLQAGSQTLGAGKYQILRRLAVGGMAEIYLAEAANIHGFRKKVVIKRILPQYANDPAFVDMFLDEARLVAQLNHASIVQVFDIGQEADGVFFTMEYIQGRDLADVLETCYKQGRPLSLGEVLAIAGPMAEALHHAHELRDDHNQLVNLIHRDVSPSNVIVTNEGRVKLLDFGVAKSRAQLRATTGVSLKGKFGYMAPEQCSDVELDRRSDIFSFGVVLWELLTGRRLFPGGNEPSVLLRIINEEAPPPSTVRADLPSELDAICLRALARDRDQRYSTLQELLGDLDAFARTTGTVTTSRTLSALISEVFIDEHPTAAYQIRGLPQSAALGAPLTPAAMDDGQGTPSNTPAGAASHAYPAVSQAQEAPSASYEQSYVQPQPRSSRKLLFLGGAVCALAIGVGLALAASGSDSAPRPSANEASGAPARAADPAPAAEVDPAQAAEAAVKVDPAQAAEPAAEVDPAQAADAAVKVDPAQAADAAEVDPAQAAEAAVKVDPAQAAEPRPDSAKKARRSRKNSTSRSRRSNTKKRKTGGKNTDTSEDEEWDPNSPFAPE